MRRGFGGGLRARAPGVVGAVQAVRHASAIQTAAAREMPAPFNCALPPSVPLIRFLNVAACLHRWTPTPLRCALTPPSFILGARLIKLRTKLLHVLLNRMQMVCSQCSEVREMTLFMPKRMLS